MNRTDIDFYKRAAEILRRLRIGTLATAFRSAKPWNTPLLMERDAEFRFYWVSDRQSQHGWNVRQNKHVFLVFYDSTVGDGQGRRGGVCIRANAHELIEPVEIRRACLLRRQGSDYAQQFMDPAVRRVYRAIPLESKLRIELCSEESSECHETL